MHEHKGQKHKRVQQEDSDIYPRTEVSEVE